MRAQEKSSVERMLTINALSKERRRNETLSNMSQHSVTSLSHRSGRCDRPLPCPFPYTFLEAF
jgi:hypothetical protein